MVVPVPTHRFMADRIWIVAAATSTRVVWI